MAELEFLKSKGLIKDGFTKFIISGDFGKVELTELLKEYKEQQFSLQGVSVMLPLLEVNRETLTILTEYYKQGEKIEAIKMLIAEVEKTYYHFGIKEARKVLEGN